MALAQQTARRFCWMSPLPVDLRYQVDIIELLPNLNPRSRPHGGHRHDLNFAVNYADLLVFLKKARSPGD